MHRWLPHSDPLPDVAGPSWAATKPGTPARIEALVLDAIKRHNLRSVAEIARHAGIGVDPCRRLLVDLRNRGRLHSLRISDNVGSTRRKRRTELPEYESEGLSSLDTARAHARDQRAGSSATVSIASWDNLPAEE